jgi:trk system potassium uptake protein
VNRSRAPAAAGAGFPEAARRRRESALLHPIGWAILIAGCGLLLSAIVDLTDGGPNADGLAVCGLVALAISSVLIRTFSLPSSATARTALLAVASSWSALVTVSWIVYLVTGGFDRPVDALFESVAGFGTAALTALPDPQVLSDGQLFWRALTQWTGGFLALILVVSILPFLGLGLPRPGRAQEPEGIQYLRTNRVRRRHRRLAVGYLVLTGIGFGLYLIGGMGVFDAATHALTTISTGGFTNQAGGFGAIDSMLLDWFAIGGMALGGSALALVARGLRGATEPLLHSIELRAYGIILVIGSALAVWWTAPAGGITGRSLTDAVFSVVSVTSTTGYTTTDWALWPGSGQVLLVVLMGMGSMAGSPGGGFRLIRVLALMDYVSRALKREVNRQGVFIVRIGDRVLDEGLLNRMVGYQIVYLTLLAAGALLLGLGGADVVTSISGAISALATVGPALGELGPVHPVADVSIWDRSVLMVLIAAGRLEIYPVLTALWVLPATVTRSWARRRA